MRQRGIVGMKSAACFYFSKLVFSPIGAVTDDDFTSQAEPVAFFVTQFKGHTVIFNFVVSIYLKWAIQSVSDDIQVPVPVYINIGVGGTVVVVVQPEFLLCRGK